jgi:hypothetical protein
MHIFRISLIYIPDGPVIEGFDIDVFASTGEEAVTIAEREHPDMVISKVVCRTC